MKLKKCENCGKKKAKNRFCSYLCYARFAVRKGHWGKKYKDMPSSRSSGLAAEKHMLRAQAFLPR